MDLLTHAVVGAVTGAHFGNPILGAIVAAAPDLVLGIQRRKLPNRAYNTSHSIAGLTVVCSAAFALAPAYTELVFWCWLSHLALDIPTHGKQWAPPLLYPFSPMRFSAGDEWEFFNPAWRLGLLWSALWIAAFW